MNLERTARHIYNHVSFLARTTYASKPVSRATLEPHGDVIRAIRDVANATLPRSLKTGHIHTSI